MVSTGFANAVVTGIVTGSIVALGAIGLALVYSIAEVPNFAHGELLTIGAYMAILVNEPGTVPVYELLTTSERAATLPGLGVLFVISVGAVLVTVSHFGGREALAGSWWPIDVPPPVAVGTHLAVAAVLGAIVLLSTPSIWGGMLFAVLIMAAFTPYIERVVFRKFRNRGVDLATMLIVALGLSFVLRFSLQAYFGGGNRPYTVPKIAEVAGVDVPLSAAQFFDFYVTGGGVTVEMINTRAVTAGTGFETLAIVFYSWPAVAVVGLATLAAAAGGYRWRAAGGDGGFTSGQTVGPRLTGGIAGIVTFAVLALALPAVGTALGVGVLASGSVGQIPDAFVYSSRIRISLLRAATVGLAVTMMGALHLLLKETKLGIAMRASSDNIDLAKVTGINTERVMMATWIIAGAYAALAGVTLGILFPKLTPNTGFFLLLPMFAGVILGGVGSVYGAIIGSFVVGLSMEVGFWALPVAQVHRISLGFVVLLVVLLVKPEGITGGS